MNIQKISIHAGTMAVVLVCCAIPSLAQTSFRAPEVTSVTGILYPIQSIADGVVVLDVSLNDKGAITASTVVRDIPSLTPAATSSIQSWKFTPASRQGKPEPSVVRVAVVFRPRVYFAAGPVFTPFLSEGGTKREDQRYVPPGIVSVTYPQYPINAAAPGTVVIQVIVGKSQSIQRLKVVRDLPPFTQFALSAANQWRFQAATLNGRPITSNLVVAFVFPALSER
jgi:outer membrane biosynthesis protein TonB